MIDSAVALWCFLATASARPYVPAQPYSQVSQHRQSLTLDGLVVDLGYALYQGAGVPGSHIHVWRGIRYAADTSGRNRWQRPQIPAVDRTPVNTANVFAIRCPQSSNSNGNVISEPHPGSEDCLFLNVYAPRDAFNLPVLVWIHGGGYGGNDGQQDLTHLINANDGGFVGVTIQYRLGAFGFLSSAQVSGSGVVNAGILDQILALQWVQQYIAQFGGDARRVTIAGESAGAGSVMLLNMAYGGALGTSLFAQSIAASPYLPVQHDYNGSMPEYTYDAFAHHAGCSPHGPDTFDCLVRKDSWTLQRASSMVATSSIFGTWAFYPVTDFDLIPDLPSSQLTTGKLNGHSILAGNNALEGAGFVPQNITTEDDLQAYLQLILPAFSHKDLESVLNMYGSSDLSHGVGTPLFATSGTSPPSFVVQSSMATGHLQRAIAIYSELTFVCSAYWMGEARRQDRGLQHEPASTRGPSGHGAPKSYRYQYSVTPALHAQDLPAYFGPPQSFHSQDFELAVRRIWGNFITASDPSIPSEIANGLSTSNATAHPASAWPAHDATTGWAMLNLNESSSTTAAVPAADGRPPYIFPSGEIRNDLSLVNARTWEGGRGERCDFWRRMGDKVNQRGPWDAASRRASDLDLDLDLDPDLEDSQYGRLRTKTTLVIAILLLGSLLLAVMWWRRRRSGLRRARVGVGDRNESHQGPRSGDGRKLFND